MPPDGVCGLAADDGGERFRRGLLHFAQAAKVNQQPLPGLRAYSGNVQEFGVSTQQTKGCATLVEHAEHIEHQQDDQYGT